MSTAESRPATKEEQRAIRKANWTAKKWSAIVAALDEAHRVAKETGTKPALRLVKGNLVSTEKADMSTQETQPQASTGSADYKFNVVGVFDIPNHYLPIRSDHNNIVGFKLPDGSEVRLIVALEVFKPATPSLPGHFLYITNESVMDSLGFGSLEYDNVHFEQA